MERNIHFTKEEEENILYWALRFLNDSDNKIAQNRLKEMYKKYTISSKNYKKSLIANSFYEYIRSLLTLPLNEIFNPNGLKEFLDVDGDLEVSLKSLKNSCIYNERTGRINDSFFEVLGCMNNSLDREQQNMATILNVIRPYKDVQGYEFMQKLYEILRTAICFKIDVDSKFKPKVDIEKRIPINSDSIWDSKELMEFTTAVIEYCTEEAKKADVLEVIPEVIKAVTSFKNCFTTLPEATEIKLCVCCGQPIEDNGLCTSYITCKEHPLYLENKRIVTKQLNKDETYWVTKKGIQFYIARTGIIEYLVAKDIESFLKDEKIPSKVILYPEMDAAGDIQILFTDYNKSIYIDLKDWADSEKLKEKVNANAGQFKNKNILLVPQYRFEKYTAAEKNSLQKKLKEKTKNTDKTYCLLASDARSNTYNIKNILRRIYKEIQCKEGETTAISFFLEDI